MQTVETRKASRVSRRGLVTVAIAAGACAAGAAAAPKLVPLAEEEIKTAALAELKELEGISLDAAIEAAELTRLAVSVIVLPVAQLVAFLGSGALALVIGALNAAHGALSFLHLSTDTVDALRTVVESWQAGLSSLPIALSAYTTADINSAEAYLRALKKVVAQQPSQG